MDIKQIRILQANCWKSREKVMVHLFGEREVRNLEILAIQEPYINSYTDQVTTYSQMLGNRFHLLIKPVSRYTDAAHMPRVCFFISKSLDPKKWTIQHHTKDLSTLTLRTGIGSIHIHNAYNPSPATGQPSVIRPLHNVLAEHPGQQHVVVGDFNLHHPLWARPDYNHRHEEADELVNLAADHGLELLTPPGTITYDKHMGRRCHQTTVDLAWATTPVADRLVRCQDRRDWLHAADHVPIITELDISVQKSLEKLKARWLETNWDTLLRTLAADLQPAGPLTSAGEVDTAVDHLIGAIQHSAEGNIPIARITPYSRPEYPQELKRLRNEVNRTRRWAASGQEEDIKTFRRARNTLSRATVKLNRGSHRTQVEDATESVEGFWKLARWARRRGAVQPTYTPTLHVGDQTYDTPERKAQVLRETLLPMPPEADLSDISGYRYPEPIQMPAMTEQEVRRAVLRAAPNKTPGPDGIPNLALHRALALPVFLTYLTDLFNACLQLGYCPKHFRKSTTVVLRKPGKPDYTSPKAYRPIALLNTVGKALEAVIATRLSYLVEAHGLLPQNHIGGRRGRSCEHAIHLLLERIHASWRAGAPVATLLTLDVSGAFDNTAHQRLIHNLRKRQVPLRIVNWIASFLCHRTTEIVLMEGAMGQTSTNTGIPQGSPLSPILYLFYNADLIDWIHTAYPGRAMVTGYIDDICILVWSRSAIANCQRLERIHRIAEQWEAQHASRFAPAKYGLIHFWRNLRGVAKPVDETDVPIRVRGVEIRPVSVLRYLGIQLDQHLTGIKQIEHCRVKAAEMTAALCSIAGSTWGITLAHLRRMYTAVLWPQVTFASSTWFLQAGWGFKAAENAARRTLESIQYQALYRIAGAFRTTSRAALEICLNIPPPIIAMERTAKESYLRVATSPLITTLEEIRQSGQRRAPRNSRERRMRWTAGPDHDPLTSPLERWGRRVSAADRLETIDPYVVPPWQSNPEVRVAETREAALAAHQTTLRIGATVIAYTDGSLTEQGVGAAVVSTLGRQATRIGSPATHTVYAAELRGIEMALAQIYKSIDPATQCPDQTRIGIIFTDNQAAIQACAAPRRSSGQYILHQISQLAARLRGHGWNIQLQWLPGHEGVYGNECADALAKDATGFPARDDTEEPVLMASTRRVLRMKEVEAWRAEWATNAHGSSLRRLWKEPSRAPMLLYQGMRRAATSVLIQMQTGKIALASYLGTFGAMESTECSCGRGRQDVRHILLHCTNQAGPRARHLTQGSRRELDYRSYLTRPDLAPKAVRFMLETGLLGQFRAIAATYRVMMTDPRQPAAQCS